MVLPPFRLPRHARVVWPSSPCGRHHMVVSWSHMISLRAARARLPPAGPALLRETLDHTP